MSWGCVWLCFLATIVHVQARLGKCEVIWNCGADYWAPLACIRFNNASPISVRFPCFKIFAQFTTMSAASAAHGAEGTSRRLMATFTSSLVHASTTWCPTARRPSWSLQCTYRGQRLMETPQSITSWWPSTLCHCASLRTGWRWKKNCEWTSLISLIVLKKHLCFVFSLTFPFFFIASNCHITMQECKWKKTVFISSSKLKLALFSRGTAMTPSR